MAGNNTDDGSCIYPGCTDSTALTTTLTANLDDGWFMVVRYIATMIHCDDGTCQYPNTCVDNIIHDRVVFNWDDMNSSIYQVDQVRIRYREVGTNSYSTKTMGVPVGNM